MFKFNNDSFMDMRQCSEITLDMQTLLPLDSEFSWYEEYETALKQSFADKVADLVTNVMTRYERVYEGYVYNEDDDQEFVPATVTGDDFEVAVYYEDNGYGGAKLEINLGNLFEDRLSENDIFVDSSDIMVSTTWWLIDQLNNDMEALYEAMNDASGDNSYMLVMDEAA